MALTDKQERFCKEYLIDCNASAAYVRAGYSPKGANSLSARLMAKDSVRARIAGLMAEKDSALIATGDEVLRYLTQVLRGQGPDGEPMTEDVAMPVGCGEGCSEIEHTEVRVSTRDRTKAAELLGKRYGLFTEKVELTDDRPVIIDDVKGMAAHADGKAD